MIKLMIEKVFFCPFCGKKLTKQKVCEVINPFNVPKHSSTEFKKKIEQLRKEVNETLRNLGLPPVRKHYRVIEYYKCPNNHEWWIHKIGVIVLEERRGE
jgi:hypothetical protein